MRTKVGSPSCSSGSKGQSSRIARRAQCLGHTFGVAQSQQDIIVQELDVNYPAVAAWIQAADVVGSRGRGAADSVDNLYLGFKYADLKRTL